MPKMAIKNTSKEWEDFRGFPKHTKKLWMGAIRYVILKNIAKVTNKLELK